MSLRNCQLSVTTITNPTTRMRPWKTPIPTVHLEEAAAEVQDLTLRVETFERRARAHERAELMVLERR
jgi:hypothetical protein